MSIEIDATRRERIERYKEERRLALRERFKTPEGVLCDDETIKRLKAKSLKSPDEYSANIDVLIKQPKRLVKITTYEEREIATNNPRQKDWYTQSLERNKCVKNVTKGLVASRVNQLFKSTTSCDEVLNQPTLKTIADKSTSK